jgi:hypothetical protein
MTVQSFSVERHSRTTEDRHNRGEYRDEQRGPIVGACSDPRGKLAPPIRPGADFVVAQTVI